MKVLNQYHGPILPRAHAKALGWNFYLAAMTCPSGHHCPKYTGAKQCKGCREAKSTCPEHKRRCREWAQRNPDYYKEYDERRRDEKREADKERYYTRTPEEIARDRIEGRARCAAWRIRNPDKLAEIDRNRKARLRGAEGLHTAEDIATIAEVQGGLCAYYWHCGQILGEDKHADHIIPIVLGGTNWPDNIQLTCPFCNLSKGAKTHAEFVDYLSRKLAA